MEEYEEDIIRRNARFFAIGTWPEVINVSIPDRQMAKGPDNLYMVSIIDLGPRPKDHKLEHNSLIKDDEIPF